MRWRQVLGLWLVLVALTAVYLRTSPPAERGTGSARRPRLLTVAPAGVRELVIERAGRTIRATRTGARWTVVEPPDAAIPIDLVAAFADALLGAEEIERVGGADADVAAFGLDDAAVRVELRTDGPATEVVLLGTANASGTAIYARREGTPAVSLIGRNIRYYEDLLFQALPVGRAPAGAPVGG
jgi:Domain of unknown function (DUF4340)